MSQLNDGLAGEVSRDCQWCHASKPYAGRNNKVFRGEKVGPMVITARAIQLAKEYIKLCKGIQSKPKSSKKWEPPDIGWLKINTDGAFSMEEYQGGAGVVIRDDQGKASVIAWELCPNESALLAEVWAIRLGLQLASRGSNIILETD
ncbi:uncharacterized protein [Typha angustifolia]|uniref:uncharacterized protein n=1 Tax=Typha angustifolia TaxID=59011 RepID=UPI003C2D7708